jgi:hypothetical protein
LINYGDEEASTKDDSSADSTYAMTPHVNVSPSPRSDDRQRTQILEDLGSRSHRKPTRKPSVSSNESDTSLESAVIPKPRSVIWHKRKNFINILKKNMRDYGEVKPVIVIISMIHL